MYEDFKGKVALVTGGGNGIGRTTAIAFSNHGCKVVINDLVEESCQETLELIRQTGGEAIFCPADVTNEDAVESMIHKVVGTYGRLDFAFNNAGILGGTSRNEFWNTELFRKTFDTNALGVFICMKYEVARMLKQGFGAIVNSSSIAGIAGSGQPSYVGAKHAVTGMTRAVALKYARSGIRVNAICPGATRTRMLERLTGADKATIEKLKDAYPMKRIGEPEEIADAVLFLCSDQATFITGHPLAVDGVLISAEICPGIFIEN